MTYIASKIKLYMQMHEMMHYRTIRALHYKTPILQHDLNMLHQCMHGLGLNLANDY